MKTPKTYCAFLRGVNVNGTRMKMLELCKVFESCGFSDVESVLATGNIIFKSEYEKESLKRKIEDALSDYFNYEPFIFLKTKDEIKDILERNPFEKTEECHLYCFLTTVGLEEDLLEKFNQSATTDFEKAEIVNQNFYWKVPKGETLDSDFGKILGNKNLKSHLTSRNINTIEKVFTKMDKL